MITDTGRMRRSLVRLAEELGDHGVPIDYDDEVLLEEVHYARFPRVHEGNTADYGSLVLPDDGDLDAVDVALSERPLAPYQLVRADETPVEVARRFADGQAAFLVRGEGVTAVACFGQPVEFEAGIVELQEATGASIVQRTRGSVVKLYLDDTIAVWDAARWVTKPYASRVTPVVQRIIEAPDIEVLRGLLELSYHWLSPREHGATLVWSLAQDPDELTQIDRSSCLRAPGLRLTHPEHFAAMTSALSQTDGATLLSPDGSVNALATTLLFDEDASSLVPAPFGTRHSSARWFSFEHPRTLVVVVSEDGPVSVYCNGARIGLERLDVRPADRPDGLWEEDLRRCDRCDGVSLIDLAPSDEAEGSETLSCSVCGTTIGPAPTGSIVRGAIDGSDA